MCKHVMGEVEVEAYWKLRQQLKELVTEWRCMEDANRNVVFSSEEHDAAACTYECCAYDLECVLEGGE